MAKVGRKTIDITGKRSGTLTAIRPDGKDSSGSNVWLCRCDCGKEVRLRVNHINRNLAKSCGCANPRGTTHGKSRIKGPDREVYKIWGEMKRRCYDPSSDSFERYGARGIYVCTEWLDDVARFIADMGPRPKGYQIDRTDNDGPYSPENCRWRTAGENSRNTRRNFNFAAFGRTQCLAEWSREFGINHVTLLKRLDRGWDAEEALTTPADTRRGQNNSKVTKHELFGELKTLKEWATAYNLTVAAVYARMKKGKTLEEALSHPLDPRNIPRKERE